MKMRSLLTAILMLIAPLCVLAQSTATVSGVVTNKRTQKPMPYVTVGLVAETNSSDNKYVVTDDKGQYRFSGVSLRKYTIESSFVGFEKGVKELNVNQAKTYNLNIVMKVDAMKIDDVVVKGRATRAKQQGDSLIYNADAFKVLKGSSAEDLLAKMPGIVVEGGEVQAQGEAVKKVMVDGKEFFEGDVNLALRTLPSDIIQNIEVFDKKSEQAEFTGFDDGEQIKTINITTKSGFKSGTFGEVYGGYGTEDRYKLGGNFNIFDGDRRISILGLSNNINQQNFSQEDLAGVMSSTKKRRGPGGPGGPGGHGGNASDNFMVNSLSGITSSNAFGFNYSDKWGEKVEFTGSYFFNQSSNDTVTDLLREYFETSMPMSYVEYSESQMDNWNHRFNSKIDYKINRSTTMTFIPKLSFQNNESVSSYNGYNELDGVKSDSVYSESDKESTAYSAGLDMIYRHRFAKMGRTFSVMMSGSMSNTDADTYTDYIQSVLGGDPSSATTDQLKISETPKYTLRGNVMYTEALSRSLMLSANYEVSLNNTDSDNSVYNLDPVTDLYDQLDESLSSVYESDYLTQKAGLGLRFFNIGGLMGMAKVDFQWASLNGEQTLPVAPDKDNNYFSVLPTLFMRYGKDKTNSFMLRYRSYSSTPSISDLQEVIDNSNPLFLSSGNPDLDQQINHTANIRYVRTSSKGTSFIAMLGGTLRQDYVAENTIVATEDMVLSPTVTLEKGAQYTIPINLDGYYSAQAMLTYGFPIDLIRSNINFSVSGNYANVPTLFDGVESNTRELTLVPKVIIGSNISENLDFTLTYSSSMSYALSTGKNTNSDDYTTNTASAKLGWTFWKGLTLRSTFSYVGYTGIEMDDPNYYLWGASLGKKFLKDNSAEIKIEATDMLNENRAFSRTVGSNYYDYTTSNVLQPYIMATFVYTFR